MAPPVPLYLCPVLKYMQERYNTMLQIAIPLVSTWNLGRSEKTGEKIVTY